MSSVLAVSGLAGLPPGPELGAALDELDLSTVVGERLVEVLRAQARQRAHVEGRYLGAMVTLGRAVPGTAARLARVSDWACSEVAAALMLTGQGADRALGFAETVVDGLPVVHAAMLGGTIDRARAWVYADLLADLTVAQRAVICAATVPDAGGWTTGQLRARLQRLILDIDPDWASRRYRRAIRERRVVAYLDADGTVTLTASGLPADQAAAAYERLQQLAGRIQRAGHPALIGAIKTDLLLGLLNGTLHHLTDQQIITWFLTRPTDDHDEHPGAADGSGTETTGGSDDTQDADESCDGVDTRPDADNSPDGHLSETTAAAQDAHRPNGPEAADASTDPPANPDRSPGSERAGATPDGPTDPDGSKSESTGGATADPTHFEGPHDRGEADTADDAAGDVAEAAARIQPRTGVEIRVGLSTALGLDARCGEIPAHGPVLPETARHLLVDQHHGAQWRFAITDPDGHLIFGGLTRHRPTQPVEQQRRSRGGVVELHVSVELLARLAASPILTGPWAAVITDITTQYAHRHHALARLNAHPDDRFARAALALHINMRDRTCTGIGCRRTTHTCDKDHTHDHTHRGPTTTENLAPACSRHHRHKTKHWWQLIQPTPGHFQWTSPLGAIYRTRGEPINPPTVTPCPRPPTPDPGIAMLDPQPPLQPPPATTPDPPDNHDPPPF